MAEKPPEMKVDDYKQEKASERKYVQEIANFKKNIFLLNKQEMLKDYVNIIKSPL